MKRQDRPGFNQRKSSTVHYQTFPTPPPKSRGQPPSLSPSSSNDGTQKPRSKSNASNPQETPLPNRQLAVLAIIVLAEQTALNSISPYLPQMVSSFPEVDPGQVGLYVGTIVSFFALAQFATNSLWGWASDRIGRKPVMLLGTLLTAACFAAFGFCRTLWQAILVQVLMGLVNGNQAVVSTCLREITDRSNQSKASVYLPIIYGLGGITGPLIGGTLASTQSQPSQDEPFPYIRPNIFSAAILIVDLILTMMFLDESIEEALDLPLGRSVTNVFSWVCQFASSSRPVYLNNTATHRRSSYLNGNATIDEEDENEPEVDTWSRESIPTLLPRHATDLGRKQVFTRDTILLLSTFMIFQLSNISYNSLYPIFGQAAPPTGRSLSPKEIGVSLAFAGVMTILFQLGFLGRMRQKIGNKTSYKVGLAGMALAYFFMPWVGYRYVQNGDGGISSGKGWLYVELGIILSIKSLAAVACLASALLLTTSSASNHTVLGKLDGPAQTLLAAGCAVGPFLSGGLFSIATHIRPKGEALVFGVFGGIAFLGFLMSLGIRDGGLEAEGWDEEGSEDDEDHGEVEESS